MTENINWPKVSIITPTYNRSNTFPLALYNFENFDYPEDKIEWIIVDDGDISIKNIIPVDSRIKYYYLDKNNINTIYHKYLESYKRKKEEYNKLPKKQKRGKKPFLKFTKPFKKIPIAIKRNICVQYTTSEYILHMDDDDYYPPKSIKNRILPLLNTNIKCVACTDRGTFHTSKYISIIYKPEINLNPAKRLCCASLAYKKNFWENRKFNNDDIAFEEENFVIGRDYLSLNYEDIIIALYHKENDNPKLFNAEANGWHYMNIDDQTFNMITSFDE